MYRVSDLCARQGPRGADGGHSLADCNRQQRPTPQPSVRYQSRHPAARPHPSQHSTPPVAPPGPHVPHRAYGIDGTARAARPPTFTPAPYPPVRTHLHHLFLPRQPCSSFNPSAPAPAPIPAPGQAIDSRPHGHAADSSGARICSTPLCRCRSRLAALLSAASLCTALRPPSSPGVRHTCEAIPHAHVFLGACPPGYLRPTFLRSHAAMIRSPPQPPQNLF